jgi:predicted transposase YdaD
MRYVTSIERIAREEGRKEGREEGREEGATYVLLRLLEHRFGELPEEVAAHVQRLSLAQTEALVNHVLGAESLAQFVTHLPE